jgi:tetratricopeptide (TPR) repeat protein
MSEDVKDDGVSRRGAWAAVAVVFVVTLTAFLPALDATFIAYDDPAYVVENPMTAQGLILDVIRWSLTAEVAGNWHPLTLWSHALDVTLWGHQAWGHHLTSITLHALAAALLALFVRRVSSSITAAIAGGLLWGIHPLRVESVAWIAERKDVLSGLFLVLVLVAWERFAVTKRPGFYVVALALAAAGLMAKPMLVTVPGLLLLVDIWPLARVKERGWRALVVEKIPFAVLALADAVVTFLVQQAGGAVTTLDRLSPLERLANAVVGLARYVEKTLLPVDLVLPYRLPPEGHPAATVAVSLVVVVVITALVAFLAAKKRDPRALVAWAFFVAALVPVIGLVHVGLAAFANRYTYVPHMLPAVATAIAIAQAMKGRSRVVVVTAWSLLGGALVVLAVRTRHETAFFHDTRTLFSRTVEVEPENDVGWQELAIVSLVEGRPRDAVEPAKKAVEYGPRVLSNYVVLGRALSGAGDDAAAIEAWVDVLTVDPSHAEAHARLAVSLAATGDVAHAKSEAARALESGPLPPDVVTRLKALGALP